MQRKMIMRVALGSVLLATLVALGLAWAAWSWSTSPLPLQRDTRVLIGAGDTLGAVSGRLAHAGSLDHPRMLDMLGKLTGADARIRQGEYLVTVGTTPRGLLDLLQSTRTIRYRVTLPEGIRLQDALHILQGADGIRRTLSGTRDPRLLALVTPAADPEGLFLPDTYQYERGNSDYDVLFVAHAKMQEALQAAWEERLPALPLESPYELLILASIIERETGVAHERPEIAGVFVRRMLRNMRLQTDPTVIYGLGDAFDGNLRRSHLRDESNPYNTYRHFGLPPTPIALPGQAAIRAAAQPAQGSALYFVARGDGSHVFSDTLEAHEAAVKQFQLQRVQNYRSTPKAGSEP